MGHVLPIINSQKSNSVNFDFGNLNGKVNTTSSPSSLVSCSTNLNWKYNNINSNFIGNNINAENRSFYFLNKINFFNDQLQIKQNTGFDETTGFQEYSIVQWDYSFLHLYSKFLYSGQNLGDILYLTGKLPFHMKLNYCMYDLFGWEPAWFSQIMFHDQKRLFMTYGFGSEYGWFLKGGAVFSCLSTKYGIVNFYDSEDDLLHVVLAMNPDLSETDFDVFQTSEFKNSGTLEYKDLPGYQSFTNNGLSVDLSRHDQNLEIGARWHFDFGQTKFLRKQFRCSLWVGEHYDFGLERNVESAGLSLSNDQFGVDLGGDNQKNLSINFSANL